MSQIRYDSRGRYLDSSTLSVPVRYSSLISDLIDWLNCDLPQDLSKRNCRYRLIAFLISSNYGFDNSELPRPVLFWRDHSSKCLYPLTLSFIRNLVRDCDSIYSDTVLVDVLSYLGCVSSTGSLPSYSYIHRLNLDYYGRYHQFFPSGLKDVAYHKSFKLNQCFQYIDTNRTILMDLIKTSLEIDL